MTTVVCTATAVTDPWDLVSATQAGDREAFGRLYDRYVDVVFRYVANRIEDRQLVEDFTSETFLRALRRIDSATDQGKDFGCWLVTIARNLINDHVKCSRTRLERPVEKIPEQWPGCEPEDPIVARETEVALRGCVARLTPAQRECVTLRFWVGLSVNETATVMGRDPGAVKALQHRAVQTLARVWHGGR